MILKAAGDATDNTGQKVDCCPFINKKHQNYW
jgi:hypothetical protein